MQMQMRNFEKLGMTREQSERLTRDLTEILCINKDKIAAQFVSKSTLEKVLLCSAILPLAPHLACSLRSAYVLGRRLGSILEGTLMCVPCTQSAA